MKIAIVGAASTYTPELIDGFARLRVALPIDELWLVDPDVARLSLVAGMAERMLARAGYPVRLHATADLVAAATDADAVLIQLRIGGQEARKGDETWPHEVHCIGQETTGPGGFAKALRTVPVVLDIAEVIRKHAKPDAWIVDFTNPVGIVTRALLAAGHRAIGLCNVAIGFQRRFAERFDVAPADVVLGHAGLNHLTWIRSVEVNGVDRMGELLETARGELAEDVEIPEQVLADLSAIPSYYLRYFYEHDVVLTEQLGAPTRAEAVMDVERELLALYADPTVDTKPDALARRGGAFYSEAAIELLVSLFDDEGHVRVVNVRNDGTLPFLPDDHVIEVPAHVRRGSVTTLAVPQLAPEMAGLVASVAGYERLALEAAVHGGRDRVVRAMRAHPLVLQHERAERLTDLLLANNKEFLPWA